MGAGTDKGKLVFRSLPQARYFFDGVVGQRITANVEQWLLPAPRANPGMIQMFQARDRLPRPNWVPWAGEFAGKYLISAIQALRMNESAPLRDEVERVIRQLIAHQASDGYLGPFPKEIRLKANWDLWGHYHILLAFLMWHEATGDRASLQAGRAIGDLVCATFLDTNLRVIQAGSPEMNMAILHGLGWLYRETRQPRYFQMMQEIEKDWPEAGDYLQTGLAGVEFFRSPKPRWESLHSLQGLLELYRITGETRYKTAFVHQWRSILRWDRRNTGGFSSEEQATGNPYAPTAIETCCTIAWMALCVDMLQLTGEARAADELELTTYNAALGAQHPSGRWWTYSTPMDGTREASAHSIVFQARAGTPELNCCSVNGARSLGQLSEWAVMESEKGMVLNYFGPGTFQGKLPDQTPVAFQIETDYPISGRVAIRVEPLVPRTFQLKLRIPGWAGAASVRLNNRAAGDVIPGRYHDLERRWKSGDRLQIDMDLDLRAMAGDREALGRISVYRGPLLLAYDQRFNAFDEHELPPVHWSRFSESKVLDAPRSDPADLLRPWLLVDVPGSDGRKVRLCDFASAGSAGTRYRSWLSALDPPPPPVVTRSPTDGQVLPGGPILIRWTGGDRTAAAFEQYILAISRQETVSDPLIEIGGLRTNWVWLDESKSNLLAEKTPYFWSVTTVHRNGRTRSVKPFASFRIDRSLARAEPGDAIEPGAERLLVADLEHGPDPIAGKLVRAKNFSVVKTPGDFITGSLKTDGEQGLISYFVDRFPEEDFSAAVWVKIHSAPEKRLGQILSAWSGPMDDPLRICVEGGKVHARIEAGRGYSTEGVEVETGVWRHYGVVKSGTYLDFYVDGRLRGRASAPLFVDSNSQQVALGGNPRYAGNEHLEAQFARFKLFGKALTAEEMAALSERSRDP